MRWKSLGILGLLAAALLLSAATSGETVTRLEALDWDGEILVLRLDGPYESRSFSMEEPERLVIDLPGVRSALRSHRLPGHGMVAAIRVGQNEADTDTGLRCRVVLDLDAPQRFDLERGAAALRIVPREARDTTPPAHTKRAGVELTEAPTPAAEAAVATADPLPQAAPEAVSTSAPAAAPLLAAGAAQPVAVMPDGGDAMSTPPWERDGETPIADAAPEAEDVVAPEAESIEAPAAESIEAPAAQADEAPAAQADEAPAADEPVFMMTQYGPVPVSVAEPRDVARIEQAAEPMPVEESRTTAQADQHAPAPEPAAMAQADQNAPAPEPAAMAQADQNAPVTEPQAVAQADQNAPVTEPQAVAQADQNAPVEESRAVAQADEPAPAVEPAAPAVRQGPMLPQGVAVASAGADARKSAPASGLTVTSETVRAEPVQDTAPPEMEAAVQAPAKTTQVASAAPAAATGRPATVARHADVTPAAAKPVPVRAAAAPQAAPAAVSLGPGAKAPEAPITLDIRGAEFRTLLQAFSEFSGQNIITGRDVKGKVSVQLKGVPWKQALYAICEAHGFGVVEEYGIFRVASRQAITQEEMERLTNEKKRIEYQPLETGVVKLHYAVASELTDPLGKMLSERGKVDVDERTNSLLVTDLAEYVSKVIAMAHELDHVMPQVEIKARIVDMDYRTSRDLGIHWLAENLVSDPLDAVGSIDVNGEFADPMAQVKLGTVKDWGQLSVTLQALERDNKADIISNPHVMTMDNREAKILVGKKIPLIVADEAGNAITQLTTIGIKLQVTPHINPEGKIMMNLHTEVSDLASEATVQGGVIITTSESTNEVMVGNGETAVIGGLIKSSDSKLRDGVPVLSKIPIMGRLFSYQNDTQNKRELFIFITPTIIQPQSGDSAALPSEFIDEAASF